MSIKKGYIEITNCCNLSCSFCRKPSRPQGFMTASAFQRAAEQAALHTKYVYLHVLGEPLLHPELEEIFSVCNDLGLRVHLTTNGTLIPQKGDMLMAQPSLASINYSLHSENGYPDYLRNILYHCLNHNIPHILRLWRGDNSFVKDIANYFNIPVPLTAPVSLGNGERLRDNIYLQVMEAFTWPELNAPEIFTKGRCLGIKNNIGILADGTVVPCCLDAGGDIPLGNIFTESLTDILNSDKAKAIKQGFNNGMVIEPLCRTCGFALQRIAKH